MIIDENSFSANPIDYCADADEAYTQDNPDAPIWAPDVSTDIGLLLVPCRDTTDVTVERREDTILVAGRRVVIRGCSDILSRVFLGNVEIGSPRATPPSLKG